MGDISIIARRLADGHVQYGWSGNGGYFRNTGIRLLAWYDDPQRVEYLFGLGELSLIGKPGSEKGGCSWIYTHGLTGHPHMLDTTERMIFSQIAFIDYGYFYDIDHRWYYVIPGPFRIKIPLEYIYHVTKEGSEDEFEFRRIASREVIQYMLGDYLRKDTSFDTLLKEKKIQPDELLAELLAEDFPIHRLFDRHKDVFSYFDDWILAVTDESDKKIVRYIIKPQTEKHMETIEWNKN